MFSVFHRPSLNAIRGVLSASNTTLQLHSLPFGSIPQRFGRSVPVDKLPGSATASEPYDGTKLPPASGQMEGAPESDAKTFQGPLDILEGYNEEQSEDCLRLDISMPRDITSSSKLPVLVFIHGGAYFIGSGSKPYYSPLNFLRQAISANTPLVFVSLRYRLGALGFLHSTSAKDHIPPNTQQRLVRPAPGVQMAREEHRRIRRRSFPAQPHWPIGRRRVRLPAQHCRVRQCMAQEHSFLRKPSHHAWQHARRARRQLPIASGKDGHKECKDEIRRGSNRRDDRGGRAED